MKWDFFNGEKYSMQVLAEMKRKYLQAHTLHGSEIIFSWITTDMKLNFIKISHVYNFKPW